MFRYILTVVILLQVYKETKGQKTNIPQPTSAPGTGSSSKPPPKRNGTGNGGSTGTGNTELYQHVPFIGLVTIRHHNKVSHNTNNHKYCAGTILDTHWFLTTARCVMNTSTRTYHPHAVFVNLGYNEVDILSGYANPDRQVLDIVIHPDFTNSAPYKADIALLIFEEPFDNIVTARFKKFPRTNSKSCSVYGYAAQGKTEEITPKNIAYWLPLKKDDINTITSNCTDKNNKDVTVHMQYTLCGNFKENSLGCESIYGSLLVCEEGAICGILSRVSETFKCTDKEHITLYFMDLGEYIPFIENRDYFVYDPFDTSANGVYKSSYQNMYIIVICFMIIMFSVTAF